MLNREIELKPPCNRFTTIIYIQMCISLKKSNAFNLELSAHRHDEPYYQDGLTALKLLTLTQHLDGLCARYVKKLRNERQQLHYILATRTYNKRTYKSNTRTEKKPLFRPCITIHLLSFKHIFYTMSHCNTWPLFVPTVSSLLFIYVTTTLNTKFLIVFHLPVVHRPYKESVAQSSRFISWPIDGKINQRTTALLTLTFLKSAKTLLSPSTRQTI